VSARARVACLSVVLLILTAGGAATAQTAPDEPAAETFTIFPHPGDSRWWLSGQINLIEQWHGQFTSPYQGANSFRPESEQALSRLWTIYTGVRLPGHTEVLVDIESAGGRGLSDALGLAGFTNLDVVRNPTLGSTPYLARAMVHATIALSDETEAVTPNALNLASRVPVRRIEIRVGKMGLADFFDVNAAGGDSHLQFTNWTVDNNGAYDYAADTRGYTYAAMVEYDAPHWAIRYAEALMPTVANGIDLDWNLSQARGDNLELELRPTSDFSLKLLGYANHANMGSYDEANQAFESGTGAVPDIVAHRQQGRVKTGAALNVEYSLRPAARLFARTGWNEGHNESFAYTEVNNSVQVGGDLTGMFWHRSHDRVGIAFVSNGLSGPHREYLQLGGQGFLLGDGTLTYGREMIVETYYTAHLWRGVFGSAGAQFIDHPGYNQDRGPITVGMLRLHLEF
jgi:high affinity Mn2+ porin